MPTATLSNYMWIPKSAVTGTPSEFAPSWEYEIKLLDTPEGRQKQQQIAAMREEFGDELDIKDITEDDTLLIKNWADHGKWWALSLGDERKVQRLAKTLGLTLDDKRVEAPWPQPLADALKMVMEPREYQVAPFERWLAAGHGIFHAAPAFGKTFIMIWLIMMLKQRTLVLVHTDALAEQFITRFRHGSPVNDDEEDGDFIPVTNCVDVERGLGKGLGMEIVGRYRSPDKIYPVTVATWQSFISEGGSLALKKLKKEFGLILCDEAHVFAAPRAASVVNAFWAARRSGVTATPTRKDKLDKALYDILGPITAKGDAKQLPLTSTLISTGTSYRGSKIPRRNEWSLILNALTKSATRNDLITTWVEFDIENGRNILLLSDRRSWCLDMAERLNKDGIPTEVVVGGMKATQRDRIIANMMEGKTRVICATQVFKLGVDIPRADTLYATCPMSNKELLEQMAGRIRRRYDGKKEPVLRYFVDEGHGLIYGCARSTHRHLVELGSDIILVETGKKPEKVAFGDGYGTGAEAASEERRQARRSRGLRAAAERAPTAVRKLFDDLKEEVRQSDRYKRRLEGKKT